VRSRRWFLGSLGAAGLAGVLSPAISQAASARPRVLSFRNVHTGEFARATYWAAGEYLKEGLSQIDQVLRDHRTNLTHAIDRRLLGVLDALQARLDTVEPFEVISGYRSPATNAMLAHTTSGVAPGSLHVMGMAIDIRVPGRPLPVVRDAAKELQSGGVGYYAASNFVHVDVGRVRYW
jgi:uncharacterized protein YcbK (DUF882 family)